MLLVIWEKNNFLMNLSLKIYIGGQLCLWQLSFLRYGSNEFMSQLDALVW